MAETRPASADSGAAPPWTDLPLGQLRTASLFTRMALKDLDEALWRVVPPGFSTHLQWVFGHALLAKARFGLWIPAPEADPVLNVPLYEACFERGSSSGSMPPEAPGKKILIEDARRLDEALERLWPAWAGQSPDRPVLSPIPMVRTLGESLLFASSHQLYHAGQFALLRRALLAAR